MTTHLVFLTLLLGLVSGRQPVAVQVDAAVKRVAIVLDGRTVATLGEAPWGTEIDLGEPLVPHDLTAIAYGADGMELARQTQLVNLQRPLAEASIVVGRGVAAVRWQHLTGEKPREVRLLLDRKPLPLGSDYRATLPKLGRDAVHVLSTTVRFADGVVARKEVVFGGVYAEDTQAELTAVAVADPECLGKQAVAVEKPPALVLFVRDPRPDEAAARLAGSVSAALDTTKLQRFFTLGDAAVRFVWPSATKVRVGPESLTEVFDHSADLDGERGVYWFLTRLGGADFEGSPRMADAVAVAGVMALDAARRRAVVLVVGQDRRDGSRHRAAAVREYLASIAVPLYVWSLRGAAPDLVAAWGPNIEDVSRFDLLHDATERLRRDLERQRIAWVAASPIAALRLAKDCAR